MIPASTDRDNVVEIERLMLDFASGTGLSPLGEKPRRYLWTDAFAVCNFLELYRLTKEPRYLDLATGLVEQVHLTLGKHRSDDRRRGWISGLDEEEGSRHPTSGGLRIGKTVNERAEGETPDPEAEWEQDGQYYHYLTKWMHALVRVGRVTGEPRYVIWAADLAKRAHSAFAYSVPGGERRMYWKMSIDLSRPLVPSMGQHDAVDGFVTYLEVDAALSDLVQPPSRTDLSAEITDIASMCRRSQLLTDDALGLGGLLSDCLRACQLISMGRDLNVLLCEKLLDASSKGLGYFAEEGTLRMPAEYRLAFREFGLAIGIEGLEMIRRTVEANRGRFSEAHRLEQLMNSLAKRTSIADDIERFWRDERHWKLASWLEHKDINMVMLATCISPDSFLVI